MIPEYLREPLIRAYTERAKPVWVEDSTQTGPPIRRKLYDKAPDFFNVQWVLDEVEILAFDGWFKLETDQGVSSFTIPLLTPNGIQDHDCTFKGNPTYKIDGKRTRVSATLSARFKLFDTDENIQTLLDFLQDLFDTGDPRPSQTAIFFTQFMTVTLPDKWAKFL